MDSTVRREFTQTLGRRCYNTHSTVGKHKSAHYYAKEMSNKDWKCNYHLNAFNSFTLFKQFPSLKVLGRRLQCLHFRLRTDGGRQELHHDGEGQRRRPGGHHTQAVSGSLPADQLRQQSRRSILSGGKGDIERLQSYKLQSR